MCGDDKSFHDIKISSKPIYIELHCSTMPESTVIFIPFNHEVVFFGNPEHNEKVFYKELMENYLRDPRNIIVLVIEKDYEINRNMLCFRGARQFDLKRTRTLGVITGLDTATTPEKFCHI